MRPAAIDDVYMVRRATRPNDSVDAIDACVQGHDLKRLGVRSMFTHGSFEALNLLLAVIRLAERGFVLCGDQPNLPHRTPPCREPSCAASDR